MNIGNIILIILVNLLSINDGEYRVYYDKVPSYLYSVFDDIKYEIFPANLTIDILLSKIGGTLLYIVDKHTNQLIVSLSDAIPVTLVVEYNGRRSYLSLPKICRCEPCIYEILHLRIMRFRSSIHISCNDGISHQVDSGHFKRFNKGYPMPYIQSATNETGSHQAYLWLVNTPQYKNVYPNSDQLSGCIFNVSYNNREIIFTNITDNIKRKCTKTCIDDICNGGQCYETYNTEPVCNCTMTFRNGDYCNDSVRAINKQSTSKEFTFELFKLSWNSSTTDLMILKNKYRLIRVFVNQDGLVLEYQFKQVSSTTSVLLKNYEKNKEYIVIVQFKDALMDVKLYHNGIWGYTVLRTERDLTNEVFDSLTLRSGDGVIDVASKSSPREFIWKSIKLRSGIQLREDIKSNKVEIEAVVTKGAVVDAYRRDIALYTVGGLFVLVICIMVVFVGIYMRYRATRYKTYLPVWDYPVHETTMIRLMRWLNPQGEENRINNSYEMSAMYQYDARNESLRLALRRGSASGNEVHNRRGFQDPRISPLLTDEDISGSFTSIVVNAESETLHGGLGSNDDSNSDARMSK